MNHVMSDKCIEDKRIYGSPIARRWAQGRNSRFPLTVQEYDWSAVILVRFDNVGKPTGGQECPRSDNLSCARQEHFQLSASTVGGQLRRLRI